MKRARPWLALIAVLALLLRWGIACRSLEALDRWFIPDDTYYTLGFARSLAHGLGPTLDGVVLSSGFQPLLAFLLVPVFWLTHGNDAPLRAVLFLSALCDAAVVLLLGRIAERLAGRRAGITTACLWALSPLAIANALGGLETSLALALELTLVLLYCQIREQAPRALHARSWALLGLCAGLAVLARIDAVFLVLALALVELLALARRRDEPSRGPLLAAGSALLVLLPWWSYCTLRFGSPIPESGAAVLQITRLHRELYLTLPKQLGWAAGSVLGPPFPDFPWLRELLFDQATLGVLAFAATAGALLTAIWRWALVEADPKAARRAAGALALHAFGVLLFYAGVLPALWFFRRYLSPCQAVFTLGFGVTLAWAWPRLTSAARSGAVRAACALAWLAAALLALLGLLRVGQFASLTPRGSRDFGLHGAKGYREAARGVLAQVPQGRVLGAFQSGALSYYAPPGVQVVNLDGVVDRNARHAATELRLSDYAVARGVTLLADWPFNLEAFTHLSSKARAWPTTRRIEIQVEPQGLDGFVLLELHWPDSRELPASP